MPEIQKPIETITVRCSCCGEDVASRIKMGHLYSSVDRLTLTFTDGDLPPLLISVVFKAVPSAQDAIDNSAPSKESSPAARPTVECTEYPNKPQSLWTDAEKDSVSKAQHYWKMITSQS